MKEIKLYPIGEIESPITIPQAAPRQGQEAHIQGKVIIKPEYIRAIKGLRPGDYIWVLCWFHLARRDVLEVYPRMARERGLSGVFTSRSPSRPNPIGLELVKILQIEGNTLWVEGLDAVNGTPVLDIKLFFPQIDCPSDR